MVALDDLKSVTKWREFLLICLLFIIISWVSQYLLISDTLYYNTFSNQLNYERIELIIEKGKEWQWFGYLIIPVFYLLKLSLIATCLGLGFFFTNDRFNFKTFFNVAVFAELIFLLPSIIKTLWFLFVKTDYDLNDLTLFYPLSALNLFNAETLPRYWLAPLQTLNLFEVAYWFFARLWRGRCYGFFAQTGVWPGHVVLRRWISIVGRTGYVSNHNLFVNS